jgi:hypothetical protein
MTGFIFHCPDTGLQSSTHETQEEAELGILEHIDEHVESAAYRVFISNERVGYSLEEIEEQMREEWKAEMSVCEI